MNNKLQLYNLLLNSSNLIRIISQYGDRKRKNQKKKLNLQEAGEIEEKRRKEEEGETEEIGKGRKTIGIIEAETTNEITGIARIGIKKIIEEEEDITEEAIGEKEEEIEDKEEETEDREAIEEDGTEEVTEAIEVIEVVIEATEEIEEIEGAIAVVGEEDIEEDIKVGIETITRPNMTIS